MPGTGSTDGDNASCEVNSHPAARSSPHPKWNASEFQCSICYELLLNPVVGSCGHDFCKHCIEEWKVSRQLVGQAVLCPICRAVLLPSTDQSFGVCIRLRETIEKLFPEQVAVRRRQTGLAEKSRKCAGDRGPAAYPLASSSPSASTATTSTSTDTSTTTSSNGTTSNGSPGSLGSPSGGGAPGPPSAAAGSFPLLDLDLLNRAAEQYRELSLLVSAITSVPAPPAVVVQAFTQAAAHMADHAANRSGPGGHLAAPLPPQQAAELARLFLSSGAALTSTAAAAAMQQQQQQQQQQYNFQGHSHLQHQAFQPQPYTQPYPHLHPHRHDAAFAFDPATAASTAAAVASMSAPDAANSAAMAAQLAAAAAAAGSGGVGGAPTPAAVHQGGFLEAALTLLTSAAATSTAAGQLRALVSALHHQQQAAAAEGGGGGATAQEGSREAGSSVAAASEAAGDALRTTANTVQQLTAEAAAMSHLLRMHHQQQLQAHMAAAAQAQAAAAAQAQLLQLQAQQQAQYLGRYLMAAAAPQHQQHHPHHPQQVLLSWGAATSASSTPFLIVGASQTQGLHQGAYHIASHGQHPYGTLPYQQQPYMSLPVAAATSAAPAIPPVISISPAAGGVAPSLEVPSWGQFGGGSGAAFQPDPASMGPWSSATGGAISGPGHPLCLPLAAHARLFAQSYTTAAAMNMPPPAAAAAGGVPHPPPIVGAGSSVQPMQVGMAEVQDAAVALHASMRPQQVQVQPQLLLQPQQQVMPLLPFAPQAVPLGAGGAVGVPVGGTIGPELAMS